MGISFSFGMQKSKLHQFLQRKKAVIFTMAAFIVLSMFLEILNQKYRYFYRCFYIAKICGNNFITALFMSVKISVKVFVI